MTAQRYKKIRNTDALPKSRGATSSRTPTISTTIQVITPTEFIQMMT
jgi:hypothetical protein